MASLRNFCLVSVITVRFREASTVLGRKAKGYPHDQLGGGVAFGVGQIIGNDFGDAIADPGKERLGLISAQALLDGPCLLEGSSHMGLSPTGLVSQQVDKGHAEVRQAEINGEIAPGFMAGGQPRDGGREELLRRTRGQLTVGVREPMGEFVEGLMVDTQRV